MDFEEYLQMLQVGTGGAQGNEVAAQPLVYQPMLQQGLLGDMGAKNQQNIQGMLSTTQQGIQDGMNASQRLQGQQAAQMNATESQLQQKIAQDEARKRQMMGLALTFATGGFGGGAGAAGMPGMNMNMMPMM